MSMAMMMLGMQVRKDIPIKEEIENKKSNCDAL
jgi:hypothetical protein